MVAQFKVAQSSAVYVGEYQPTNMPRTLVVFDPQAIAEPGGCYGFLSLVRSDEATFDEEPCWEDAAWQ